MSDLFSSLLIFTIIKTILSTFFFTVSSKFYKNLVKWAWTEIESSVAGTTTLDREWVPLVEQELLTLPEHLSSPQFLVRFVLLDLRILIAPLVSATLLYPHFD